MSCWDDKRIQTNNFTEKFPVGITKKILKENKNGEFDRILDKYE